METLLATAHDEAKLERMPLGDLLDLYDELEAAYDLLSKLPSEQRTEALPMMRRLSAAGMRISARTRAIIG